MAAVSLGPQFEDEIRSRTRRWLVTGAAGFIGSHLVEILLGRGQHVVGLDNFATGHRRNLDEVRANVGDSDWRRFSFVEGDIRDFATCSGVCADVEIVLHQAALGSVPRSLADPLATHAANATGFLNVLVAARDAKVQRFVYAASSSTYGDHPGLPKVEERIGRPLSPYAVTKYLNELYADVFARSYGIEVIGLRYFNVFGARQDPDGPYAAVIPAWARRILRQQPCTIYGDGETSRDFCAIENAIQANLLAALATRPDAIDQVYNVAAGAQTTLTQLHWLLARALSDVVPELSILAPQFGPFRPGDVRHSLADIEKARERLGYVPRLDVASGLSQAAVWYVQHFAA